MILKDPSPDEYNAFKDFLESACGILLGENKQYLVKSRLHKIMEAEKSDSLADLVNRLKPGLASLNSGLRESVIDAMTTNETLWFRDNHPFRILSDIIIPEISEKIGAQPMRIWSAACSTGQEPYSVAMIVDEYKRARPAGLRGGVNIVATDISRRVLENAKTGTYEMLAIGRGLSTERQERYFRKNPDGLWQVNREIQKSVDFRVLNLLEGYSSLGKFDVIFCRNVLIYFSADLKKDILSRMHGALKPGGYLVLGASESLNTLTDKYEMVHCSPGIIYRAK
ncbi:MAG: chemotaxis protein [Gammaproteobacteria bacterium]|nr:MAG: chemotaxis protein [Pseudomonadota bacterium]PIE38008.1 MAG: chemotaxis protein [Gammaproteobacteria bacterium]